MQKVNFYFVMVLIVVDHWWDHWWDHPLVLWCLWLHSHKQVSKRASGSVASSDTSSTTATSHWTGCPLPLGSLYPKDEEVRALQRNMAITNGTPRNLISSYPLCTLILLPQHFILRCHQKLSIFMLDGTPPGHPTSLIPHLASKIPKVSELFNLDSNCIASGEVGLDYEQEHNLACGEQQEIMLQALVHKALTKGKPLLLHLCNPVGQNQVTLCCDNLLGEISVPKSYPIYLHCFSYTGWE